MGGGRGQVLTESAQMRCQDGHAHDCLCLDSRHESVSRYSTFHVAAVPAVSVCCCAHSSWSVVVSWCDCTTLLPPQHMTWLWEQNSCAGTPAKHKKHRCCMHSNLPGMIISKMHLSMQEQLLRDNEDVIGGTFAPKRLFSCSCMH